MPGDPHGGLTTCRYYGAHSLEDVSCGRVGCWLVRRPSIECFCFWCREELLQPESGSCPCDTSTEAHPAIRPSSSSWIFSVCQARITRPRSSRGNSCRRRPARRLPG